MFLPVEVKPPSGEYAEACYHPVITLRVQHGLQIQYNTGMLLGVFGKCRGSGEVEGRLPHAGATETNGKFRHFHRLLS